MAGIERTIEILQETDSPADIHNFIQTQLDSIVDYVLLEAYTEGPKTTKLGALDFIKNALFQKHMVNSLCTEKYIFGLRSIRKNGHAKKVSDGVVSMCYEIYTDGMKLLLESAPACVLEIISKKTGLCYFEEILKSSDCNGIVEMFPCFFSLSEHNFIQWIKFLSDRNCISLILKFFTRLKKAQKDLQNLSKFLYLFVSFTGNVFRDSAYMNATGRHYSYFYKEIEKRVLPLFDVIFVESDAINRLACLEVLREMIRVIEYIPNNSAILVSLYKYLVHSEILKELAQGNHQPGVAVRIVYLINTISLTVRFKSPHTLSFLRTTNILSHIAEYLHGTSTHTITNEVCLLINELIYVDKIFYIDEIVEFCQAIRLKTFKQVIQIYSTSQKKHSPHASIIDCITPVISILYKLYYICLYESSNRSKEMKTQSRRFVVIDETSKPYRILQELEFLQDEQAYWYITTRVLEHGKRLSLEHSRSLPERLPNSEQFARYFCEYTAAILPAYPPWLFQ
ncbi:uncharacterized protein NESG_01484 [Nematocida ausubeli]|uniref:Uncharacterized protein n=1 Tax=Nematocida ausubeli (strain ATCC PRA-371 / ERTm2) TaxID=1913371 RepID=A0A086J2J5_NEMA1|nr:uncharacterized protein NESG_01484 [Nematocida ausubeli]KFG26363.1 hypothetical protein NESG_01484 [Nematocida ausubeli]